MEGIALKNGAIGDRITVRNTSSNKTLEGFVNGEKFQFFVKFIEFLS